METKAISFFIGKVILKQAVEIKVILFLTFLICSFCIKRILAKTEHDLTIAYVKYWKIYKDVYDIYKYYKQCFLIYESWPTIEIISWAIPP